MTSLHIDGSTAGQFIPKDNFTASGNASIAYPEFTAFIGNLTQWIHWENHSDEMRRHRKWLRALMYYEGRQLGRIGIDGYWRDVQPLPTDPYYVDNKYRFHAKSVRKEWVRSNGEYMARAKGSSMEYESAARAAKAVLISEQQRLLDPYKKRREANYAILTGNYFRYTWIDSTRGQVIQMPQYESIPMMVGSQGVYCPACDMSSGLDVQEPIPVEEIACPQCGSPDVSPMGGEVVEMPTQTGAIPTKAGQLVCEIVDPMEIKLHLHARSIEDSPYLRRRRLVLKEVIEATYPWLRNRTSSGASSLESSFWFTNELERSAGNSTGSGGYMVSSTGGTAESFDKLHEFNQFWLEPVLYENYIFSNDVTLANEEVIPKNTRLGDIFPDGLYMAMIGPKAILDMRNESKNDHWVHGVYDCISTRIWGDGNDDAVEQQRQRNEVTSLIMENIMNCAGMSAIYNPLKISRNDFSGKPREMTPLRNATLADRPQDYVYSPPPRPVGGEPPMYVQMLDQSMQSAFGSFNAVNGLGDADNKTATGISIVRDSTATLLGDPLELRSALDLKHGMQILKLVQKHASSSPEVAELYLPTLGDHGRYEWEAFLRANLDTQIDITVRQHSWMPRNEDQLRNDILEALTAAGIPGGVYSPAFPPDARLETMKRLNIPFDMDKQQVDTRKQYIEIQKILQVVGQATQQMQMMEQELMADPMAQQELADAPPEAQMMLQAQIDPIMMSLEQVPVEALVDEHIFHIEEIKRWLKTDIAEQVAPIGSPERQAIMAHLQMHVQTKMQDDMVMLQMQMGAQMAMAGGQGQGGDPNAQGQQGGGGNGKPPAKGKSKNNDQGKDSSGGNGKRPSPKPPKQDNGNPQ